MKTVKYAVRFLVRSKTYTFINLLGLAFSLACCIILLRCIHRELTVDTHCVDRENVYIVCGSRNGLSHLSELPSALKSIDFRHIERHASYIPLPEDKIYIDGYSFKARTIVTDSILFQLYRYPIKQGRISLATPQAALMTESFARKVFGNENPIGKVFRHTRSEDLVVEGILAEPDCKSTLQFDVVLSSELHYGLFDRMPIGLYTFLPGTDMKVINETVKNLQITDSWKSGDINQNTYSFMPIKEMYWHGEFFSDGQLYLSGKRSYVWILSGTCLLLFIVGVINVINLYLTTLLKRGKEYGLRKVFGANTFHLFRHIYAENALLVVLALFVAWLIVEISVPLAERIFDLPFKYTQLDLWLSAAILILLPFITTLYPFLKFSMTPPIRSIQSLGKVGSSSRSRMFFLGIQYVLTFLIIVLALYFNKQLSLLLNTEPGFRTEDILSTRLCNEDLIEIDPNTDFEERARERRARYQVLKSELKACPYIENIVDDGSIIVPFTQLTFSNNLGEKVLMDVRYTCPEFFQVFDIKLIEGSFPTCENGMQIVLNRSALEALGYQRIEDAYVVENTMGLEGDTFKLKKLSHPVVGVVEDYYEGHLTMGKKPIVYKVNISGNNEFQIAYIHGKEKELLAYLEDLSEKVYGVKNFRYSFLADDVKALYENDRRMATIYMVSAFIAIVISCLGLFGVSLYDIRQRYREIGIRKINGAKISDVFRLFFRQYLWILVGAFVIAIPVSYYFINMYTCNFVVKASIDVGIYLIALLLTTFISIGTLFWQVQKAANINLAEVIKSE